MISKKSWFFVVRSSEIILCNPSAGDIRYNVNTTGTKWFTYPIIGNICAQNEGIIGLYLSSDSVLCQKKPLK